jgi:hypothetical protein
MPTRDFGNLPWSRAEAKQYAAKKGGTVSYDTDRRSWIVKVEKHPPSLTREEEAWL